MKKFCIVLALSSCATIALAQTRSSPPIPIPPIPTAPPTSPAPSGDRNMPGNHTSNAPAQGNTSAQPQGPAR